MFYLLNALATGGVITGWMKKLEPQEKVMVIIEIDLLQNVVTRKYMQVFPKILITVNVQQLSLFLQDDEGDGVYNDYARRRLDELNELCGGNKK